MGVPPVKRAITAKGAEKALKQTGSVMAAP